MPFAWIPNPPPAGSTDVNIQFSHPPRIITWSTVPGREVAAGTSLAVQAEVEFFGDGSAEQVTVQFWDDDAAGGSFVGDVESLTYDAAEELWVGSINAVSGADAISLTALDSDGTTSTEASVVVP